jgi:hypothetical protein
MFTAGTASAGIVDSCRAVRLNVATGTPAGHERTDAAPARDAVAMSVAVRAVRIGAAHFRLEHC